LRPLSGSSARRVTSSTPGDLPEFDRQAVPTPFKDNLLTVKASADINARQFLQVRYGYQRNSDIYGPSPSILPSALGTLTNDYHSILLGHTWQIGSNKVNDFVFQDTHFKNAILPTSSDLPSFTPTASVWSERQHAADDHADQAAVQRRLCVSSLYCA